MTDALRNAITLADRIAKAKDHMAGHRQHNQTLWPHQPFYLTLGELLEAAERGLRAADEVARLRAELVQAMAERGRALTVADELEQAAERAALAAPAVPPGWQFVPVEPTPEMLAAVGRCVVPEGQAWLDADARATWAAMLAAAPTAQPTRAEGDR